MVGYMLNYVFPRLGEVSRPVYVARQLKLSTGNLLGTIVLERIIDLTCLVFFLFLIAFYYVSDIEIISRIFGTENWTSDIYIIIPALILIIFFGNLGRIQVISQA
jgi:glycosyltransferase 2 family protein